MIPRLWACTDQPLPLAALATPLHPVFILALVTYASWAMLTRRAAHGRAVLRLATASTMAMGVLILLFVAVSLALLAADLDPTFVLRLAPIAWALGGTGIAALLVFYVRRKGLEAIRMDIGIPTGQAGRAVGCIWFVVLVASLMANAVIVARWWIPNVGVASLPYRLWEWGIVDEIDGPVSDECLAMRVVEYGDTDDVGGDAMDTLNSRGRSAAAGVGDKLEELRRHWPPKPYTVNGGGISWLLRFLERNGDQETRRLWSEFDYQADLQKIPESGASRFTTLVP